MERTVPHNMHALTRVRQSPKQPSGKQRRGRVVKLAQSDGEIPRKKTEGIRGKNAE